MNRESRIKKSFLNARVNLIAYTVSLFIAFFSRQIFLSRLGAEFMGLSETLNSILGFLNLAELGIGTAIGYVLYKPIYDKDHNKINEIISVLGVLYRWVGYFILFAGVVLSFFLPLFFKDTSFDASTLYIGYYCLLSTSLIGYFINYRTCILAADQRNYVVTGYFQIVNVCRTLIQMLVAMYVASFALFFIIQFFFGVVNVIILNVKVNQLYPWLKTDVRNGRALLKQYPEIFKYISQIFIHKIGALVQFQLTPIFIYKYVSLASVALYANYTTVTSRVQQLISTVLDSTGSSIGNMVAEGDNNKSYNTFRQLFLFRSLCSGIAATCCGYLVAPFVSVWLGPQYVLDWKISVIVALLMYSRMVRLVDPFLYASGLFSDVWAPFAESAICIAGAIVGGSHWGMSGVMLGQLLSQLLIVHIWKPYFLFSRGFHRSVFAYWELVARTVVLLAISGVLAWLLTSLLYTYTELAEGWSNWILGALVFSVSLSIINCLLIWLASKEIRILFKRISFAMFSRKNK